jgi:phenylalanyl-tRNA synthetase beta chain
MVVVRFSRKEFEKAVGNAEKLKEKINLFGTHLESLDKDEIALEILPNRPDMFSLQGFARAFNAFLGKKVRKYFAEKPQKDYVVKIDDSVKSVRPFTACAIVRGIRFDDEKIKAIIDVQEKLHATIGRDRRKAAIGIYPLDKIFLPITFEARKPEEIRFIPLEAEREMSAIEILQRHPTGIKYGHLLEGMEKFPVFIDARGQILSMPPIINSQTTGKVTEETRDVFIECSGFDLELLKKILNILVTMLADMGGKIFAMKLIYGNKTITTPDLREEKIKVSLENVNKLLGIDLSQGQMQKLLKRMGFGYKGGYALIPPWRLDIMHEVDIIEDIAIAYGYDNFVPELPSIMTIGEENKEESIKRKIAEILIGLNMLELSTYHLITKNEILGKENAIELEKSKTDYKYLRPSMLCSLLKVLSENVDAEYPQRVFEIGKVFSFDKTQETGIKESNHLTVGIASATTNFTEIKQVLDYLAKMLNIELKIEKPEDAPEVFIEGRVGKVLFGNQAIGFLGEVHPWVLEKFKIRMPLSALEIDIDAIIKSLEK